MELFLFSIRHKNILGIEWIRERKETNYRGIEFKDEYLENLEFDEWAIKNVVEFNDLLEERLQRIKKRRE